MDNRRLRETKMERSVIMGRAGIVTLNSVTDVSSLKRINETEIKNLNQT